MNATFAAASLVALVSDPAAALDRDVEPPHQMLHSLLAWHSCRMIAESFPDRPRAWDLCVEKAQAEAVIELAPIWLAFPNLSERCYDRHETPLERRDCVKRAFADD